MCMCELSSWHSGRTVLQPEVAELFAVVIVVHNGSEVQDNPGALLLDTGFGAARCDALHYRVSPL